MQSATARVRHAVSAGLHCRGYELCCGLEKLQIRNENMSVSNINSLNNQTPKGNKVSVRLAVNRVDQNLPINTDSQAILFTPGEEISTQPDFLRF